MQKLFFLILLLFWNPLPVGAQGFSYVYIQGDGETPIYVKLEGEMQPRYGTNYSILSRLAPGTINIEILFQQNKFPPQKFALKVPEGGARSLLLVRKEAIFLIYDLRQNFYIPEGNVAADDKYVAGNFIAYNETPAAQQQPDYRDPPAREPDRPNREPKTPVRAPAKTVKPVREVEKATPSGANTGDPTFIPDLELNRNGGTRIPKTPAGSSATRPAEKTTLPAAAQNGDQACSVPMSIAQFGDFYGRFLQQPSLDAKLTFLLDADECPTPDQARIICRSLDTEAARLRYLGRVIRRSTKKKTFAALTNVFEAAENKKALLDLTKS